MFKHWSSSRAHDRLATDVCSPNFIILLLLGGFAAYYTVNQLEFAVLPTLGYVLEGVSLASPSAIGKPFRLLQAATSIQKGSTTPGTSSTYRSRGLVCLDKILRLS